MKLYTRTGDDGTTGLFGGDRVGKDHPRVEAYGTVDELNAAVGLAINAAGGHGQAGRGGELILEILAKLQPRLFDLGAELATPHGSKHESKVHRMSNADVAEAEGWIDRIEAGNSPMTHFVMPGGTELSARLHLARTICRRAERLMVHLGRSEQINTHAIVYVNRISDLLFALARRANKEAGVADVTWMPRAKSVPSID